MGRRVVRVRPDIRPMRNWLALMTGSVLVELQAASAAIVLAGVAWLAGVSSGGVAHALHGERSAGIAALGATALLARTGLRRIAWRPYVAARRTSRRTGNVRTSWLMTATSRNVRTASPVFPSARRDEAGWTVQAAVVLPATAVLTS